MELINDIKLIYSHLDDDTSKEIFCNRLLYSFTDDEKYIRKVIATTEGGRSFLDAINSSKRKFVFSAGVWGREIVETFADVKFDGFIDNKVKKYNTSETCLGLPLVSFDKYLKEYSRDSLVIIASRLYHNPIYNQLIDAEVSGDLIVNAGFVTDELSKKQYFDLPQLANCKKRKECFVDAGSFDGKSSLYFYNWCKDDTDKIEIFAFEPDNKNAEKCEEAISELGERPKYSYEVIRKGLWNKKDELRFEPVSNGTSSVTDEGSIIIEVDKMENMLPQNKEITFIKMDLEGSEYEAIDGARKIIEQFKPKLAISIYHKKEDIWKLPKLILDICPDYKLYIRHYSIASYETVLYALPNK